MSRIPTIAMIPSGYKASKVYSVLPTNGDGDLTFARTGVANRENQIGLIEEMATGVPRLEYDNGGCPNLLLEPASTNLVSYSEDFSNWANSSSTLTSGVSSPDGGTNAYNILAGAGSSNRVQLTVSGLSVSTVYNLSCYVKKEGSDDTARIDFDATEGRNGVQFTFSTEVLSNANGTTSDRKVESLLNGWYRISFNFTTDTSITSPSVQINRGNTSLSSNYFGVQLEELSYVTSYIETSGATATRNAETVTTGIGFQPIIDTTANDFVLFYEKSATNDDVTLGGDSPIFLYKNSSSTNQFSLERFRSNDLRIYSYIESSYLETGLANWSDAWKLAIRYVASTKVYSFFVNGVKQTDFSGTVSPDIDNFQISTGLGILSLKDLRGYNEALTDAELITLTT